MNDQLNPLGPTYDMDTATIARQHAEIMRLHRRISDMRLDILKLVLAVQRDDIRTATPDDEFALVLKLEEIRGDPA